MRRAFLLTLVRSTPSAALLALSLAACAGPGARPTGVPAMDPAALVAAPDRSAAKTPRFMAARSTSSQTVSW